MTSSLRNSLHRRNHKERSQLAHRSKLGILEKHGDYVKRARDYHSKQDRLNRLKQKAAERNKDEFYFSMQNERTKGGVHIKDRGNVALPTDIVKVLKTQDENYIRTMRMAGLKKIDKLKSQLTAMADLLKSSLPEDETAGNSLSEEELQTLSDAGIIPGKKSDRRWAGRNHIVFVDNEEEARRYRPPENRLPTSEDEKSPPKVEEGMDFGWKLTGTRKSSMGSSFIHDSSEATADAQGNLGENRSRLLKELSARLARDKQLRYAQRELEMQRLMMGKGSRKKIAGVEEVEGNSDEEDEDEIDAQKGKRRKFVHKVDEKTYKPRVYKWRLERK